MRIQIDNLTGVSPGLGGKNNVADEVYAPAGVSIGAGADLVRDTVAKENDDLK